MKKYLIVAAIVVLFSFQFVSAQTNLDSLGNVIRNFNFESYEGKPVDTLIANLPVGYTEIKLYGHLTSHKVHFLGIQYPGNISICVYVLKYRYMNPIDDNRIWNLSLYKQEEICAVDVVNPY